MATTWQIVVDAELDVVPAADPSCVDIHPGEPCPGLPHEEQS